MFPELLSTSAGARENLITQEFKGRNLRENSAVLNDESGECLLLGPQCQGRFFLVTQAPQGSSRHPVIVTVSGRVDVSGLS